MSPQVSKKKYGQTVVGDLDLPIMERNSLNEVWQHWISVL